MPYPSSNWPFIRAEGKQFCDSCPKCQLHSPYKPPLVPQIPLPIIEVPFERIGLDIVGPLPKTALGHKYILVILDYATRFPEAVPLRKATSQAITQELVLLISRVGISKEILTDQGTQFISKLISVNSFRSTSCEPQSIIPSRTG